MRESATIDYFATSLPNLLVFEEDLQARRDAENHLLRALAFCGLGDSVSARSALEMTHAFNHADQRAMDYGALEAEVLGLWPLFAFSLAPAFQPLQVVLGSVI